MTPDTNQTAGDVAAKMEAEEFWITEYLSAGGLFNPEMMNHDKVRDALMRHRDVFTSAIAQLKRMAAENERLQGDGVHSCSDTCQRPLCVMRRKLAAAERELARIDKLCGKTVLDLAERQAAALTEERAHADALAVALTYFVAGGDGEHDEWVKASQTLAAHAARHSGRSVSATPRSAGD